MKKPEPPRTHKWLRTDRPPEATPLLPELHARIPGGVAPEAAELAHAIRAALVGWPIVILRVVGRVEGRLQLGRHPGRWVRAEIGRIVDERMCICDGPRCTRDDCWAGSLLGRHGKGPKPEGEAWAPFTVRAAEMPEGNITERGNIKFELVFAGWSAIEQIPSLVRALQDPPPPPYGAGTITWTAIHALRVDEDGDPRWKKVDLDGPPPLFPLDRVSEPRVRRGRLTLTFLTATPIALQGEQGTPTAELSLVVDRMSRSFGAWMGRTGHRGPRLPVEGMLKAAAAATLAADNSRPVEVPGMLLGAAGSREDMDARTASLIGSITWKGDFSGLAPLLVAAHYIGMGPGRQHALGQIVIR